MQKIAITLLLIGALTIPGCSRKSKADRAKAIIGEKLLIILGKQLDENSNVLDVQDYITDDGQSYVPFFSSEKALKESTQGADLEKPVIKIDRRLFIQMVQPQDILVLNIGLSSEISFTGKELKKIFPEPFIIEENKRP